MEPSRELRSLERISTFHPIMASFIPLETDSDQRMASKRRRDCLHEIECVRMLGILSDKCWIRHDVGQRGHNRRIFGRMIKSDVSVCGLAHGNLTGRQTRADGRIDPAYWQRPEVQSWVSGQRTLPDRGIVPIRYESSSFGRDRESRFLVHRGAPALLVSPSLAFLPRPAQIAAR